LDNGGAKNGFRKNMFGVGQRLCQFIISRWWQTVLLDQINHLGQAYGRNGNLASGGRRFVDKGFGGSGQSLVVESMPKDGPRAVRFQQLQQANAMRSQCDDQRNAAFTPARFRQSALLGI
jgi:hypothetical protein